MIPTRPSFESLALNRITFGARDVDIVRVKQIGWAAWVDDQLNPPIGDEPALASHLAPQRMRIRYGAQAPSGNIPGWTAVDQLRPLSYLQADVATLWDVARRSDISVAPNERTRIQQELNAATWIRNTHAEYQVREFLVDFWNNHFAIGRQECIYATAALPIYDAQVIRPHALGNFRALLGAVAKSASMLRFLNNSTSTAAHPNENYARELLELHTMGAAAYLGIVPDAAQSQVDAAGLRVNAGFTDADIIAASRALSGWTLEEGQDGPHGPLPFTGRFLFNPLQHNTQAGLFLGVDLSRYEGQAQGEKLLDIVADHPATAAFIVRKLCRRIFGDAPPQAAVARGVDAWLNSRAHPNQIQRVMRVLLRAGDEIALTPSKVRRPYERVIALLRTTSTVVNAYDNAHNALASLGDGLYVWATPEGRPDTDAQWQTAAANLETWNLMFQLLSNTSFRTTLADQTPVAFASSATLLVEYWVGRMVGHALRPAAMQALIDEALSPIGVVAAYRSGGITNIENALRRLTALIAISPEFGLR